MLQKYAVVDIEATGGTQKVDRIIEIAIVLVDGNQIVDSFSTMVNPGISIPPFISRLTGITNEMVSSAPPFHEVARKIVEWTRNRSLVAHNVSFDYRILREEFNRLGYDFQSDTLCTARLSKHFFPSLEKFNLKDLSGDLGIHLEDSHRALDDAQATAEIMLKILEANGDEGLELKNMNIYKRRSRLPDGIEEEQILDLPNVCGIYYMKDGDGYPVYIGKSLKIRSRIRSHFVSPNGKAHKMRKMVHAFDYKATGSELMAEILESLEIHKFKPVLNKAKRRNKNDFALLTERRNKYLSFNILHKKRLKDSDHIIQWFSSRNAAKAYISSIAEQYDLCPCMCHLQSSNGSCVTYSLGACDGAYLGHEDHKDYNDRVHNAITTIDRLFLRDFLLLLKGRTDDENGALLIENGRLKWYGFLPKNEASVSRESIKSLMTSIESSSELDRLVYRFIYANKFVERIYL